MKDESGDMAPDEDRGAVENRETAGIARFQKAKSGNFWNDADSERKASRETFGRATDESGDMEPDEDREAVEIPRGRRESRGGRDIERQQKSRDSDD